MMLSCCFSHALLGDVVMPARMCRELGEWEHAIEAYAMALKARQHQSEQNEKETRRQETNKTEEDNQEKHQRRRTG